MSEFSRKLSELMAEKKITAYQLERLGSLKRTTITKYAGGKSKPPDNKSLEELIRMMALGAEDAEELRKAYTITKIGEPIYYRRKHVEELLRVINNTNTVYPFDLQRHSSLALKHDIECLNGKVSIVNVLGIILAMEAENENPVIRVIAQPEGNAELMSYLTTITGTEENIRVEHIICMDNKSSCSDNAYNINVLKEIMPLIVSGAGYTPYYYYDDVKAHINAFSSFPNIIITSRYVMQISYNMDRAVVSGFDDFVLMQEDMFSELKKKCDTYIQALPGPLDILTYYEKVVEGSDNIIPDFSVMPDPCLFPFLDEQIMREHAKFDLPNIDTAVDLLVDRVRRYREGMERKTEISFCTKEGFRRFMETGIITEIPAVYYNPFDTDDRLLMIKRMYRAMKKGIYKLKILDDKFNIKNISFACYNEYSMTYCYNHPKKGMLAFGFRERSTVNSIYDYFTTLEEQRLLLSDEETERFVLEILGEGI
ncbi:MAG: helix-turn-helix domain-containing protein [Candidatus Ornithomonoglobus sp.]